MAPKIKDQPGPVPKRAVPPSLPPSYDNKQVEIKE